MSQISIKFRNFELRSKKLTLGFLAPTSYASVLKKRFPKIYLGNRSLNRIFAKGKEETCAY